MQPLRVFRRMPLLLSASPLIAVSLTSLPVHAGNNSIHITKVHGEGYLHVIKDSSAAGFHLQNSKDVLVDTELRCRYSGYRARAINDQIFSTKRAVERARLKPLLPLMTPRQSSNEVKLTLDTTRKTLSPSMTAINDACARGETVAMVPVYVRGHCRKVKTVVGKKNYYVYTKANATYLLRCDGYGAPQKYTLTLYYSDRYSDHWTNRLAGGARHFAKMEIQGFSYRAKAPGSIELTEYQHKGNMDFLATTQPPPAGYEFVRSLGFIFPNYEKGTRPLKLYYSWKHHDYFTTSTPGHDKRAEALGYKFQRVLGYILDPPGG